MTKHGEGKDIGCKNAYDFMIMLSEFSWLFTSKVEFYFHPSCMHVMVPCSNKIIHLSPSILLHRLNTCWLSEQPDQPACQRISLFSSHAYLLIIYVSLSPLFFHIGLSMMSVNTAFKLIWSIKIYQSIVWQYYDVYRFISWHSR